MEGPFNSNRSLWWNSLILCLHCVHRRDIRMGCLMRINNYEQNDSYRDLDNFLECFLNEIINACAIIMNTYI